MTAHLFVVGKVKMGSVVCKAHLKVHSQIFMVKKLKFMAAEERTQVFMLSAKPLTLMHQ